MTIRTVSLFLVGVGFAFGAAIATSGNSGCSDENQKLIEPTSSVIASLAKGPLQDPPPGGGFVDGAMRVGGNGTPLRIEYRQNGKLIGVDRLGSDSQLVRRDIMMNGHVHAYEFFTEGRLVRLEILTRDGSLVCTSQQRILVPPLFRANGY
jgi:hypothetical protein